MRQVILSGLLYGLIFSGWIIIGGIFWNPRFPWITFAIIGSFFVLPLWKIVVPLTADSTRRINRPRTPRPPDA